MAAKSSGLLKVMSIIFIVIGIIGIIIGIIGLIGLGVGGGLMATLGIFTSTVTTATLYMILWLAITIAMVVAGFLGYKASKLNVCFIIGILILVLAIISLILSITGGYFTWTTIIPIIIPLLYIYGIKQSQN